MVIISSLTDIRTWVANNNPGNVSTVNGEEVTARAIQAADHPAYGDDWSEWLDANSNQLALDATEELASR